MLLLKVTPLHILIPHPHPPTEVKSEQIGTLQRIYLYLLPLSKSQPRKAGQAAREQSEVLLRISAATATAAVQIPSNSRIS